MGDTEVCSCPAAISASLNEHGCAIKHSSIPSRKDAGCQGHELGVELRWGRGCAAGDRTVVATRPFAEGAVVWREDPYEYVWALACAFARSSSFARRRCLSPTPLASLRHASFVQHLVRGSEHNTSSSSPSPCVISIHSNKMASHVPHPVTPTLQFTFNSQPPSVLSWPAVASVWSPLVGLGVSLASIGTAFRSH